jgi:predicted dehydrogenase
MGMSHALAYARIEGFEVAGLCARHVGEVTLASSLAGVPQFTRYEDALAATKPDLVSINTFTDTHADYAIKAMEAGAHVFVEKPLAETVADAERVVAAASRQKRKLVVGYILRHHPSWVRFIEIARTLGSPMVFRMNLNQQSAGREWETHKRLMQSLSPIVDCGVHGRSASMPLARG